MWEYKVIIHRLLILVIMEFHVFMQFNITQFHIFYAVSYCLHISFCNYAVSYFWRPFSADATVKSIPILWSTVSYWWCLIEITLISVHQILAPETRYIGTLLPILQIVKLQNVGCVQVAQYKQFLHVSPQCKSHLQVNLDQFCCNSKGRVLKSWKNTYDNRL